jgi:hypothetical protein
VPLGKQRTFVATIVGTSNTGVTWSIQEGPTGGSIDANGVYTAPTTAGSYHIVATSQGIPSESDTAIIVVLQPRLYGIHWDDSAKVYSVGVVDENSGALLSSSTIGVNGNDIDLANRAAYDPIAQKFFTEGDMLGTGNQPSFQFLSIGAQDGATSSYSVPNEIDNMQYDYVQSTLYAFSSGQNAIVAMNTSGVVVKTLLNMKWVDSSAYDVGNHIYYAYGYDSANGNDIQNYFYVVNTATGAVAKYPVQLAPSIGMVYDGVSNKLYGVAYCQDYSSCDDENSPHFVLTIGSIDLSSGAFTEIATVGNGINDGGGRMAYDPDGHRLMFDGYSGTADSDCLVIFNTARELQMRTLFPAVITI